MRRQYSYLRLGKMTAVLGMSRNMTPSLMIILTSLNTEHCSDNMLLTDDWSLELWRTVSIFMWTEVISSLSITDSAMLLSVLHHSL